MHHMLSSLLLAALLLLPRAAAARPGDLDLTFNGTGTVSTPIGSTIARATAVVQQTDGKIVAAGYESNGDDLDVAVVRYTATGALDTTFNGTGIVTKDIQGGDDQAMAVIQQADGKILVAGLSYDSSFSTSQVLLMRLLQDGTPDSGFGSNGIVTTQVGVDFDAGLAVVQQGDGKLAVAGYSGSDLAVLRYALNGDPDATFNTTGFVTTTVGSISSAHAIVQQGTSLVVAGQSDNDIVLVRYDSGGTVDATFGGGSGPVTTPVGSGAAMGNALVQDASGRLVVAGASNNGTDNDFALVRYSADGVPDGGFGTSGIVTTPIGSGDDVANGLQTDAEGHLVAAGSSSNGTNLDIALVRYDDDGTPDSLFGTAGIVTTPIGSGDDQALALTTQSDRKLVVAGVTATGLGTTAVAVARYRTDYACGQGPPTGTYSCDDGLFCNGADTCTGTSCTHAGNPCTTAPACANVCDEGARACVATAAGGACTGDGTDLCTTGQCDGHGACAPVGAPDPGCSVPLASGAASLRLKEKPGKSAANALAFVWGKGTVTAKTDFGDPTGATQYALCLYANGTDLVLDANPRTGAGSPWKATKPGFKYRTKQPVPDGVTAVLLKSSTKPGKARVTVAAKGSSLALPTLPIATTSGLVAQVRSSDGKCWGATFSHPSKSDNKKFVAKSD
jgi:uncharacterized delta-60 repeat protein